MGVALPFAPVAFPRKSLNSYEEIVVDLNPHWWFFAGPAASLVSLLVVLAAVEILFDVTWLRFVLLPLIAVALLWMAWRLITWRTTHFVVTTDRLIYQAGVFAKRGIQIPLERVNNVNFNQNLLERILGTGDLLIESGGESGQQRFSDIKQPDHIQNVIHAQVEANENRKFGMAGSMAPGNAQPLPPPDADIVGQLEKLDALRQRGVLNDAEFQEQKAKLLGR